MSDVADLLMPKLGLTMTEGTIARWIAEPGKRFAAGDVVVIVETDKIANEVEAPAAGELVTLLWPQGAVVPVGAPIAQWRLDDGAVQQVKPAGAAQVSADAASHAHVSSSATATPQRVPHDSARIIATPYARRLAREAALDLAGVSGSGPRGRIKAADVTRALDTRVPATHAAPSRPLMPKAAPATASRAALSFVTADVDVGALKAIDSRIASSRDLSFDRRPYLALACLKALDADVDAHVRLGFESGGVLAALEGSARDTLSAVVARLDHRGASGDGGDVAIFVADGKVRRFGPAVPDGWRLALGVGGVRTVRGGGDATNEMSLVLSYDAASVDHAAAARLLDRIAALLEEPLHLLAS